MVRSEVRRRPSRSDVLDGVFFTFSALAAIWFAWLLLGESVQAGWELLLLVVFWGFLAYLLLPRLHRILTRLYVPGYFIGRTRTADGLLGDPINLALHGTEPQIHVAMERAGWIRADVLDGGSTRRMITATLTRKSYPTAPVSPLHLFDRQQDFAYQQEVGGSTSQRHHVRFWRCPEGWMLPGGYAVDWLAAGTFDTAVGLSLFTFQVTHKIEQNTDIERDFLVDSMVGAGVGVEVSVIRNFSTGYHSRNGGGDAIHTDGDLPVVDVSGVVAPPAEVVAVTDSRTLRPAPPLFGGGISLLRAALYIVIALTATLSPDSVQDVAGYSSGADSQWPVTVAYLVAASIDLVLGLAILRGSNRARLTQMMVSALTTLTIFLSVSRGHRDVTLGMLPTVGLSILVLLALSSHRSRDFAHHHRDGPPPEPPAYDEPVADRGQASSPLA
jgi:hypothetical protein